MHLINQNLIDQVAHWLVINRNFYNFVFVIDITFKFALDFLRECRRYLNCRRQLRCRSLTTFKRDFKKTFTMTPQPIYSMLPKYFNWFNNPPAYSHFEINKIEP